MDRDTRRNIVTYYLNFAVVAVVGFLVNPLLLGALGPIYFGVWKSLQRYLDFATVADGRASQALKWVVASRSKHSDVERRRDVGAAIIVWLRWLPAAALVAVLVTVAVPKLIRDIPADSVATAHTAAAILAANTVLVGLLAIPDSVLTGINQGYKSMLITTAVFIASNIAMLLAAVSGCSLWVLAVVVLAATILNSSVTLLVARRNVPWWGVARPTRADLRRVFGYSTWTLAWVGVDKLLLSSELVVISIMMGAIEVTRYTFTTYLLQFVVSIALVTASGFMPMLGSQIGARDFESAGKRAASVRHLVMGVTVVGCSAVLAFNAVFVEIWVGKGQFLGTTVNALLVVLTVQLALMRMDGQILDVTMRIAPKVLVGAVSTIGGIIGACIVFSVSKSLPLALIAVIAIRLLSNTCYPIFVARSVPNSAVPFRSKVFAGVLLIASFGAGLYMPALGWSSRALIMVTWAALALALSWFELMPKSTVTALVRRGKQSEL